jgi:uncharacterized membrane protein
MPARPIDDIADDIDGIEEIDPGESSESEPSVSGPRGTLPELATEEHEATNQRNLVSQVRARLSSAAARLTRSRYFVAVLVVAVAELVALCWLQHNAYLSFQASSGDLGVYNQSFFTTLYSGRLFYSTVTLPAGTHGNLFAIHILPFLFLLLPFYALAPGAFTLVVIKQVAIVFAALPLFFFARDRLQSERWGAVVALAYMVAPITMSFDWTNFDPEAFFPLTFFLLFYLLQRGRTLPLLGAWILAISVEETGAAILLLFIGACLVGNLLNRPSSTAVPLKTERRNLVMLFGIGAVWLAAAYYVLRVTNVNGGTFGQSYAGKFSVLGATSIPDIPLRVLSDPGAAGAALSFEVHLKIAYIIIFLACAGFLSLLGDCRFLVPFFGWVAFASLSNATSFYQFGAELPGYAIPFLFAGLAGGLAAVVRWWPEVQGSAQGESVDVSLLQRVEEIRKGIGAAQKAGRLDPETLRRSEALVRAVQANDPGEVRRLLNNFPQSETDRPDSRDGRAPVPDVDHLSELPRQSTRWRRWRSNPERVRSRPSERISRLPRVVQLGLVVLVVSSLVGASLVSSPLLSKPAITAPWFAWGGTTVSSHDDKLRAVIGLIPAGAAVLTTENLFPQVSSRVNAFVLPEHGFSAGNRTYQTIVSQYVAESQYVLVDYRVDRYGAIFTQYFTNLSSFGLRAAADGAYLYERGWMGSPTMWSPYNLTIPASEMKPGVAHLSDSVTSPFGPALVYNGGSKAGAILWTGPGPLDIPPGQYNVTFLIKLFPSGTHPQLQLRAFVSPVKIVPVQFLVTPEGGHYNVTIFPDPNNGTNITHWNVSSESASMSVDMSVTFSFNWTRVGHLDFPSTILKSGMKVYLYAVFLNQDLAAQT